MRNILLTERNVDVVHRAAGDQPDLAGRGDGGGGRVESHAHFEGVGRVLDVAVARLLPDTDGVVLVGEMSSSSKVIALESSRHSCEPLAAPGPRPPPHVALNLTVRSNIDF